MNIPKNIQEVLDILCECGFKPYLVGGCVRDTVMGCVPHDFDITSNASPEEVTECFESRGYKTYPLGREFGTVGVLTNGEVVEITPYRTESGYSDARHPDKVEFVSDIRLDLSRRDFTVNAMAIDAKGNILDLFGGRNDIEKGIIRCVGNPDERLSEDALRILRAIRFASRLGFEIENGTLEAMGRSSKLLKSISGERICTELSGILKAKHAYTVLCKCEDIIRTVIPEFSVHEKLCEDYGDFMYRLFICIYKGGRTAAQEVYRLLKLSNIERDRLFSLFLAHEALCAGGEKPIFDNSVKKLMCSLPYSAILDIFTLCDSDTSELCEFSKNGVYTADALAIRGGDIVNLGRFPRQDTAKVLRALLLKASLGELENTRDALTGFLLECDLDFYK